MAEAAAMNKLLEELSKQVQNLADVITNVDDRVATLENELRMFKAKLKDKYANTQKSNATFGEVKRRIIKAIYDMENAIEIYKTQIPEIKKQKNSIKRLWKRTSLYDVGKMVRDILVDVKAVKELTQPNQQPETDQQTEHENKRSRLNTDNAMQGFKEERRSIFNRFRKETEELDIISIIGLPGGGKTRLADYIFNHPDIISEFDDHPDHRSCRTWVDLKPVHQKEDVLLYILNKLVNVTDDMKLKTDCEKSQMVREHLQKLDRFLIVMDDVWSMDAWTDLKEAFPKFHKNGKILITTQLEEVASVTTDPIRLSQLTSEESWELLKSAVFGKKSECPAGLEPYGQLIAKKCDGLPRLIMMIGDILKRNCLDDGVFWNKNRWREVSGRLSSYFSEDDFQNMNTLFYQLLHYDLRPCFLYTGMFPEGFKIPVRTLKQLWIAEGFIHKTNKKPLEQTAHENLMELINRNLVMVVKRGPDDHIKTCRVHYMLREFCRMEASSEKENVFQEMNSKGKNQFEPANVNLDEQRRLCIGSNVSDFFTSRTSYPLVHSLFCFSEENYVKHPDKDSIPQVLKFLRVLEAKRVTFQKLSDDWSKLALLRYVVLSVSFDVIPKVMSKLQNMQTLIILTKRPMLKIQANIWKMSQLTYVKTNVPTKLPSPKKGKEANKLQRLGMISHESCTEDVFERVPSLRKLAICGQLDTLLQAKGLDSLENLEKLHLVHDVSGNGPTDGKLQRLPKSFEFPPNLRSLTLKQTKLDWKHMPTLASLINLEVLKLKHDAFRGELWSPSTGGFSKLQVLDIEKNELMVWTAPDNPFPILGFLKLRNCRNLSEIPFSLREKLQKLDLKTVGESVVNSALKIKAAKTDLLLKIDGKIYNTPVSA